MVEIRILLKRTIKKLFKGEDSVNLHTVVDLHTILSPTLYFFMTFFLILEI